MGHLVGKDLYRKLGKKIDGLSTRVPWNVNFYNILKELYTPDEAELIIKMPYNMADLDEVEKVTGYDRLDLERKLAKLCSKGLVLDFRIGDKYRYMVSPFVIGIFEFTMMRTRGELNYKEWAKLFQDYMSDKQTFYKSNFGSKNKVFTLRALPYEETIEDSEYVEIYDYEKASSIINDTKKFAIGICSCRHEKEHLGEKKCQVPLNKCSTFGSATEYMIRHGFATEVSKTEMLENLAESREMGLVLCADNVQKNVSFLCHCCGCCCNVLLGLSKHGYPNMLITSNYIAEIDRDICIECGKCIESCPINAIENNGDNSPDIDEKFCTGCGVCALSCDTEAMKLHKRKQRVIHPETSFERVILQCLERGTLQNQMFGNPNSISHKFMRLFVGTFLKLPPVKKSLMSDSLRSNFLDVMQRGM